MLYVCVFAYCLLCIGCVCVMVHQLWLIVGSVFVCCLCCMCVARVLRCFCLSVCLCGVSVIVCASCLIVSARDGCCLW